MDISRRKQRANIFFITLSGLSLAWLPLQADDVVLIPGKIDGSVQIGGETISYMQVDAYNSDDNAQQTLSPGAVSAPYSLTVNVPAGTTPSYTVRVRNIQTSDSGPSNTDYFQFPTQSVVAVEDTTQTADFILADPGYIGGTVTLTGDGELSYVWIYAYPSPTNGYAHRTYQSPVADDKTTLLYELPVSVGEQRCQGIAYLTSGAQVTLSSQTVTVNAGETANCDYTIETPPVGSMSGTVGFSGAETPNYFYVYTTSPTSKAWTKTSPDNPDEYSLPDLSVGNYLLRAYAYLNISQDVFYYPDAAFTPARNQAIAAGDSKTVDISACQAYVNGSLSLAGSLTTDDLSSGLFYFSGISPSWSAGGFGYDRLGDASGDIDLVLSQGDWRSNRFDLRFSRPQSDTADYLNERLYIYDESVMYATTAASLACGETVQRNFGYATGSVTVNFSIEGGGTLSNALLRGARCSYRDEDTDEQLYRQYLQYANSGQTGEVDVGTVTFAAAEGFCTDLEAVATVDGSQTTFGKFEIEVVAGVDVVIDLGGPEVSVIFPEANACLISDSVTVSGIAKDDVGVASVVINGVDATLNPVGGEGTLETTFEATVALVKGENTIETVATDTTDKTGSDTRTVFYDEGPPVLDWTPANGTVAQSSTITVAGTVSDDADVDSVTVNGDLVVLVSTGTSGEYSFSTTVTLEPGDNNITVVAADIGGCTDDVVEIHKVTLSDNTAPSVTEVSVVSSPISIDGDVEASCIFTDPDANDTHTVDWDWGDGTVSAGQVDGLSATGSHSYSEPGRYIISCEVIDSYGESDESQVAGYVVVYNPNGGFVTGGGWVNSPQSAYSYNASLGGKSSYGIVAKYKKGGGTPMGSTEFQFHAGRMNFHSTDYDWLIVNGDRAQYLGSGTINREAGYQFMVTVVDGGKHGGTDAFRMKIWDESDPENPVYDSQPGDPDDADPITPIGKGSIVIHKEKSK